MCAKLGKMELHLARCCCRLDHRFFGPASATCKAQLHFAPNLHANRTSRQQHHPESMMKSAANSSREPGAQARYSRLRSRTALSNFLKNYDRACDANLQGTTAFYPAFAGKTDLPAATSSRNYDQKCGKLIPGAGRLSVLQQAE